MKALRLPFLAATAVPVLLGNAIAWNNTGTWNGLTFWLTLFGVSFLHIGTNLANDYFDHKTKNDEFNQNPTPFSGGSRVIQDRLISPQLILFIALVFFCMGSLIGLYFTWTLRSGVILLLGLVGVFCGFFYTAFPFKIGYKGFGEIIVGLCFGPLVVLGSYYVQTVSFSSVALWASVPVGILITLVLYINEFPDYDADKSVNKKTLVVLLGKEKAVKVYHILLGLTYIYVLLCVLFRVIPPFTLVIFLTVPLALKAYFVSQKNFLKVYELLPSNAATIGLYLSFGLFLSVGFILDRLL